MTVPNPFPPVRPLALRIGDADRDTAAADLRHHYTDGRLTLEEFLHRLPLVLAARTAADLGPVFADLPAVAVPPPPAPRRRRRPGAPRRVLVAAAATGAVVAGTVGVTTWTAAPTRPAQTPLFRYECSQCHGAAAGQDQVGSGPLSARQEYERAVGHRSAVKPAP